MATVYIALGSNTGNREANLRMALRGMTRMSRVKAVSSLYESDAVGPEQPVYYNAACQLETGLEPESLLRFVKALEHEIGRRPGGARWGPRPIDIDILLYDDRVLETEELTIPHPGMQERAFVLVPLAEIAAESRHPALGLAIAEIAVGVDASVVRLVAAMGWDGVLETGGERVKL